MNATQRVAAFHRAFADWERAVHDVFVDLASTARGERQVTVRAIRLSDARDRAFLRFKQAARELNDAKDREIQP